MLYIAIKLSTAENNDDGLRFTAGGGRRDELVHARTALKRLIGLSRFLHLPSYADASRRLHHFVDACMDMVEHYDCSRHVVHEVNGG